MYKVAFEFALYLHSYFLILDGVYLQYSDKRISGLTHINLSYLRQVLKGSTFILFS